MTTTADKIMALPDYDAGLLNDYGGGDVAWWQDYLRAEIGRANDHWREAAAALVEAEPQAVRVKPLAWGQFREGGCVGRPKEFQYFVTQQHNGRFFCHFDESSHDHLADAQAHCDQHYQRAALDLTPTAVAASHAPEIVSPTPTLDAMAMQRAWYTAGIRAAALRYRAGSGPDSWDYFAIAEAAILDLLTFERVDPPLPSPAAALAEALELPEVKAMVAVLKKLRGGVRFVTNAEIDDALKGASHE